MSLSMKQLSISIEEKQIIKDLSLTVETGEIHVIMGPNGSGKSTLANTIAGHPSYEVTHGSVTIDGQDMTDKTPDLRAKAGLFLSMQYPPEIPGVTIANFLRVAKQSLTGEKQNPLTMHKQLTQQMQELNMDPAFLRRYLNVGLSGGEKKRLEVLQLTVLDPTYAVLDETDSGLDVDALKIVSDGINRFHGPEKAVLLITHYNRILEYIVPDKVHIMVDGRIVESGDKTLAGHIEKEGYAQFI